MRILLRALALFIIFVGCLHGAFALSADAMLGVNIPASMLRDPSINSQNRFYGVSYALYGVLLWISAADLKRYGPLFRTLLLMTFVGGLSRIASVILLGWPAPMIVALALSELSLPPILLWWHLRL
jgi:Domain of unknown function (DUF4345)